MRTLKTIFTALFFVALAANSNAQWSTVTNGVILSSPANAGIGNDPMTTAKLRLHYSTTTSLPAATFGLHSVMEDLSISSTNNKPMYGAYFKNTRINPGYMGAPPQNELYGIYLENTLQSFGKTWGIYLKNERLSNSSSAQAESYGIQLINNDPVTPAAVYGIHLSNTKGNVGNMYGIHLSNTKNGSSGSGNMYGIYSTNTNTTSASSSTYGAYFSAASSSPSASVYGIYSTVEGGASDKRYAGYFTGGNVAIMNGNVGIGTTTPTAQLDVAGVIKASEIIANKIASTEITVHDTRNENNLPNSYARTAKFEFKQRDVIGVPGTGAFSGMLTIAPWAGNSGNKHHQINFNDGGIYYRSAYYSDNAWGAWQQFILANANGNVGIGVADPQYKLDVKGAIRACDLWVNVANGCDYVFADDYNLMSLSDLGNFVKTNRHLPDIAPAVQMESEGINVSEMSTLLLKKVEELTLYVIELEKKNNVLESRLNALSK